MIQTRLAAWTRGNLVFLLSSSSQSRRCRNRYGAEGKNQWKQRSESINSTTLCIQSDCKLGEMKYRFPQALSSIDFIIDRLKLTTSHTFAMYKLLAYHKLSQALCRVCVSEMLFLTLVGALGWKMLWMRVKMVGGIIGWICELRVRVNC